MYPLKDWKKLKNGYVFRQLTWYCRHHLGLDKICKCGTEIYMPFNGTIKKLRGVQGGNTIWIYPDNQNIVIRILHCKEIKQSGKYKESEVIGWAGNTGLSRGCHIHIDISRNEVNIWNINNFIDPDKFNFNKGETMLVNEEKLNQIYQELLCRLPDEGANSYLGIPEDEVRKLVGNSEERQQIINLITHARILN